jgi:hypothetical protein
MELELMETQWASDLVSRDPQSAEQEVRWRERPQWGWAVLFLALFGSGRVEADPTVPPWFSDHLVLQQATPLTRPGDVLLWGWADKGAVVTVEFVGRGKPVVADLTTADEGPELRKWSITYGDFRGNLPPGGPFRIVVLSKSKKNVSRLHLEDALLGDIWVVGQKPDRGVPPRSGALAAACAQFQGRLRLLPAPTINWGDNPRAVTAGWRPWDDSPATSTNLANVTVYFGGNLLRRNPAVPLGLVVVPSQEVFGQRVDPATEFNRTPELKNGWEAAAEAAQEAIRDCAPAFEKFPAEILQLKREGKTLAQPLPLKIEPPARLHIGGFPSIPMATRGGIW